MYLTVFKAMGAVCSHGLFLLHSDGNAFGWGLASYDGSQTFGAASQCRHDTAPVPVDAVLRGLLSGKPYAESGQRDPRH